MKTEDVLNLDYREEKSKEIIQKVLKKIGPLSKYSENEIVPIEAIEKLISVLTRKYEIQPQWINFNYNNSIHTYSCGIKTSNTHEWLGDAYGMCVYELFAKIAIKMYSEVKTRNIPEKSPSKQEVERERRANKIDTR